METIIADLVQGFERGGLTRRQLIQALSVLLAAGTAGSVEAGQTAGLRATGIDHVSVLVSNMQRSADFYQRVFGMSAVSEDKAELTTR